MCLDYKTKEVRSRVWDEVKKNDAHAHTHTHTHTHTDTPTESFIRYCGNIREGHTKSPGSLALPREDGRLCIEACSRQAIGMIKCTEVRNGTVWGL